MVLALPDPRSTIRFLISSSHAAKTPSSTFPPRLEIRESANASCSSTERLRACSSSLATSGVICDIRHLDIGNYSAWREYPVCPRFSLIFLGRQEATQFVL